MNERDRRLVELARELERRLRRGLAKLRRPSLYEEFYEQREEMGELR
jgi:hypothetical protein